MTRTHTCTGFGRRYVDIDIGKVQDNGRYKDHCRNSINFTKVDGHPSSGYKRYTHSFSNSYYIGGIYYNRVKQDSIKVTDAGLYEKSVTVYYLDYDFTNALPLIVGLEKTHFSNEYYYYKKTSYTSASNQWKDEDRSVKQENQLPEKLTEIVKNLTTVIILRVDHVKNNTYFANGDTTTLPTINADIKIQVTGPEDVHKIYRKFTHRPTGGKSNIRLLSTKGASNKNIPFESPVYGTWCSEVCVYSWSLDSGHINPLLLELKSISYSTYYTLTKDGRAGKKWKVDPQVTTGALRKTLDRENCRNGAHVVDISKKGRSGGTTYPCPGHCGKRITVVQVNRPNYSSCFHYIYGGFIRGFKNGETEQTGITLTERISSVFVYRYPSGPEGIPLLIYLPLSSNKWFERTSLDSNSWKSVSNKPKNTFDRGGILRLLQAKLPTITINVGYTNGITDDGQSTTYEDPSEGDQKKEQINLKREDLTDSFSSFSHSIDNKDGFIVNLKHNGSPLEGVPQNLVVKNVRAYYYGESDCTLEKLLTVGFETRGTGPRNNHVYYSRESRGSAWTAIPEHKTKLNISETPTTAQLQELKEKLETKTGDGSNAGVIAGGVTGGLGVTGGRSLESSLAVIGSGFSERTGYKGYPGVYNNGSLVYDECGRIAHSEGFTREFLEKFGRFLIEKGLAPNVVFYTEHGACSLSPLYERLMKFSVMRKLPIPQVLTLEGLLQENILIIKYAEFDMKLSGLHEDVDYARTITLSNWLYTINPAGVNKALGLKKLMEHYCLSSKDCGFIGDGDNDTEAMEFCDHSFCVDDTPDYVKRHAKWVLDKGHDEGAVAQALELIYGPFSQ